MTQFKFKKKTGYGAIKSFVLVNPRNDNYYNYNMWYHWRALDAKIYNIERLENKLKALSDTSNNYLILLLPYFNWRSGEDTIYMLESTRDQLKSTHWMTLDEALDYCGNGLIEPKSEVIRPTEHYEQIKTVKSEPEPQPEPEPAPTYRWEEAKTNLNQPLFYSHFENVPTISEILKKYFKSIYHKVPLSSQIAYEDYENQEPSTIPRASNTTLDVSIMPTNDIVSLVYDLEKHYSSKLNDNFKRYTHNNIPEKILTTFNFKITLMTEEDGLYLKVGITNEEAFYVETETPTHNYILHPTPGIQPHFKYELKEIIQNWKNDHKEVILSKTYKESDWWDNEIIAVALPNPKTNLIYISYFPESKVIKVGRTTNWETRSTTYSKHAGTLPETNGIMKLCWYFETPGVDDILIDNFILYCAETKLIKHAKETMDLIDGHEFFKGREILDFCQEMNQTFKDITIKELLQERTEEQIKRYASHKSRNSKSLEEELLRLRNP